MDRKTEKTLLMLSTGFAGFLALIKGYELYKRHQLSKEKEGTEETSSKKKDSIDLRPIAGLSHIKNKNVHKIVLTGGPCAGKTTALALICDRLRERGYQVLAVPECATLVFGGGVTIDIQKLTQDENIKLHATLINYIMLQEDRYMEFASVTDQPTVVLCDRGCMDVKAYMAEEGWQALMDEYSWNTVELRDKRYDGIIHLVSAADGAEEFYNQSNAARYESQIDQAKYIDHRLREVWVGHPKFSIIDNGTKNFQEKMEKCYKAVLNLLGKEAPPRTFNRYLLKKNENWDKEGLPILPEKTAVECFSIEETFLLKTDAKNRTRIRKRGQKGNYFYQVISVDETKEQSIEVKRQISARDYLTLYERKDPKMKIVQKIRQAFVLNGHFCFIDNYTNVGDHLSVLNLNKELDVKSVNLPISLEIVRDVTDDKKFSSYGLASDSE